MSLSVGTIAVPGGGYTEGGPCLPSGLTREAVCTVLPCFRRRFGAIDFRCSTHMSSEHEGCVSGVVIPTLLIKASCSKRKQSSLVFHGFHNFGHHQFMALENAHMLLARTLLECTCSKKKTACAFLSSYSKRMQRVRKKKRSSHSEYDTMHYLKTIYGNRLVLLIRYGSMVGSLLVPVPHDTHCKYSDSHQVFHDIYIIGTSPRISSNEKLDVRLTHLVSKYTLIF